MYYIAKSRPVNKVTKENYYLFTENNSGYLLKLIDNEFYVVSEKRNLTPITSDWLWIIIKTIDKNSLSLKLFIKED